MENRENKLNFLSELIKARRHGDFTEYGLLDKKNTDRFFESVVLEFKEALEVYHKTLDSMVDKLINHLSEPETEDLS